MDYPKSVPSVGLVGGKFVDEDPTAGTPGSLIPAQWGNAVTEEVLHVITAGGLVPDEGNNTQLLDSLSSIIATQVPAATEAVAGRAKIASQALVSTGVDDTTMVSPKKLAARLAAGAPVVGTCANLKMSVPVASSTATITADEVVVKSGLAGRAWTIGGFNKLLNVANSGALGMDVLPSPVNGWLAIYAGLNEASGATTVFAQSVGNNPAPAVYGGGNAPAGITATALLTVVPTNGSGQIKICLVQGKKVRIPLATAYSGNASVSNNPISIATIVPASAIEITQGELTVMNSAQSSMSLTVGPDATYLGQQNVTHLVSAGASLTLNYAGTPIITPQQVMFTSSSSAGSPTYYFYISGYLLP